MTVLGPLFNWTLFRSKSAIRRLKIFGQRGNVPNIRKNGTAGFTRLLQKGSFSVR